MAPRKRTPEFDHLSAYKGLGVYPDGRYYFQNPYTQRQASLGTRDLSKAIAMWTVSLALCQRHYADANAERIADRLQGSNVLKSKGANIHLRDFVAKWREEVLVADKLTVKIKRNQGRKVSERTQDDYRKVALQIERADGSDFPMSSPNCITKIRLMLAPWLSHPTHYNHMKAVLGRIYDHAVLSGVVERSPMKDIDKMPVEARKVLIPDDIYVKITESLMIHQDNGRTFDGTWRARICDLFYMLSQQPVDLFSLKLSQLSLIEIDKSDEDPENWKFGEIALSRSKTAVKGVIEMNEELRETVDWLVGFRQQELDKRGSLAEEPKTDHLMIYPAYMDRRSRWQPVTHRTFSGWWRQAVEACGHKGKYWLMDMRKKGLTDEFVSQGENNKGIHESQRMRDYYRLIVPPKRSRNTLTPIGSRPKDTD